MRSMVAFVGVCWIVALLLAAACYHSHPGPVVPDPTQPPFPIKRDPCAGNIDPNCFPWPAAKRFILDGGTGG